MCQADSYNSDRITLHRTPSATVSSLNMMNLSAPVSPQKRFHVVIDHSYTFFLLSILHSSITVCYAIISCYFSLNCSNQLLHLFYHAEKEFYCSSIKHFIEILNNTVFFLTFKPVWKHDLNLFMNLWEWVPV